MKARNRDDEVIGRVRNHLDLAMPGRSGHGLALSKSLAN